MKRTIEKTTAIDAPPSKVWHVFINPKVTRQMGGEYVSEWMPGSAIGWKGKDGEMYTKGTIISIEPEKLLKHDLVDLDSDKLSSVITYTFEAQNQSTIVHAVEELNYDTDDEQFEEIADGWDFALAAVKDIAEKLG